MGDRANVIVLNRQMKKVEPKLGVGMYTHWKGSRLPFIVKQALSRKQRWDDPDYLARIIFSEMIKKDIDAEDGFGLYATQIGSVKGYLPDNEHQVLVLDTVAQTIGFHPRKNDSFAAKPNAVWTFEHFIEESDEAIRAEYEDTQ